MEPEEREENLTFHNRFLDPETGNLIKIEEPEKSPEPECQPEPKPSVRPVMMENEIKLVADSSIFVKNKDFIKEKELLAELPLTNQQTTQSKKDILSPVSGEVFLTEQTDIVWVLNGNIDFPFTNTNGLGESVFQGRQSRGH